MDLRHLLIILLFFTYLSAHAQTLGGSTSYNFLRASTSPITTASGGTNVTYLGNDAGPAFTNPALLSSNMDKELNASFTNLRGGIKIANLLGVYQSKKTATTFGLGLVYINYGEMQATDAGGNNYGTFKAVDYAIQASASRQYLQKWKYGMAAKWIHSGYGQYSSNAVAVDVAVLYHDSAQQVNISVVAKNMGVAITSFGGKGEELPFDLVVGVSKKLSKAPFGFSVAANQIHQFNLLYDDTLFNATNNFNNKESTINKIFNHFVIAGHFYIGEHIEAIAGFNHLRRSELSLGTGPGLLGFSGGVITNFKNLHISVAHTTYQKGISYNQFGLAFYLDGLVGLGH